MTRKEYVRNNSWVLKGISDRCELTQAETDYLNYLIDVLEQEPCEDCISRQATVERLCKVAEFMNEKRNGLGSPYIMAALFIQDNKDEFPSVTPKPKTDILDKIRTEIKEVQTYKMFEGEDTVYVERKDVLAIIDRYTKDGE